MKVVLISFYDLGHQPFGLASPAAYLRARGHKVATVDVSIAPPPDAILEPADVVALYLPMHTAARLAINSIPYIQSINPTTRLAAFGLYAPLNESHLRASGVTGIFGGEFEQALCDWVDGVESASSISLDRLIFPMPDRRTLPALDRYAKLRIGAESKVIGYTEATRGCKHLCRHCPVVNVYQGTFRVVSAETVLADIRQQVAAGAEHITFGDPDFFNGPTHARRIVEALHAEFPTLTYDATIKVEHLLKHRDLLPLLRDTGCLFITSAVEALDDEVLHALDKGHTRQDFLDAVALLDSVGLSLAPTFIPFTPWTTRESYRDLLLTLARLGLEEQVNPVQLALRLLIPEGSRLLELDQIQQVVQGFDPPALLHRWKHADPAIDQLAADALSLVHRHNVEKQPRAATFAALWALASQGEALPDMSHLMPRATVPYLDEPWYC